jgi:hypothetical protein
VTGTPTDSRSSPLLGSEGLERLKKRKSPTASVKVSRRAFEDLLFSTH